MTTVIRIKKVVSCLVVSTSLIISGCAQQSNMGGLADFINKENIGTLAGAVGGGFIGSNFGKGKGNTAAIAAGTLLGAFAGKSIGKSLDNADLAASKTAFDKAMGSGKSTPWNNPDSGNAGKITASKSYKNSKGTLCRDYTQQITVDGKTETVEGIACKRDGVWEIIK